MLVLNVVKKIKYNVIHSNDHPLLIISCVVTLIILLLRGSLLFYLQTPENKGFRKKKWVVNLTLPEKWQEEEHEKIKKICSFILMYSADNRM